MNYKHSIYALVLATILCASHGWADMAIIAHPACPVDSASKDEIKNLYLGKAKHLGGSKAVPVDQSKDSNVSEAFYESVVGKTASQVRAYWSKLVFTGKGRPPKQVGDDSAVVAAVAGDPTLVGYVSAGAVTSGVKVLMTVQGGVGD